MPCPRTSRTASSWCRRTASLPWATIATSASTAATGASFPYENVIGRPMFIYWSFEQPRDEYTRTSFAERVQFLFTIVHPFLRPDALVPDVPRGALMPGRVSRRALWIWVSLGVILLALFVAAVCERQPLPQPGGVCRSAARWAVRSPSRISN